MDGRTIMLLRHGEIETGGGPRFIGQIDLPLTEEGVRQVSWWRENLPWNTIEAVYSSDLSRCRRTAEIVAEDKTQTITFMPELREIRLGEWEGMSIEEVVERYPSFWEEREKDPAGVRAPDGESFNDLQTRVVPVYERIVEQTSGNVLVVAHAGVNRSILCHVLGMPLKNLFRLDQDYACLNLIEYDRRGTHVRALNVTPFDGQPHVAGGM